MSSEFGERKKGRERKQKVENEDDGVRMPSEKKKKKTNPIPSNLLPLHLLPRDRQLPPQRLELPLAQARKSAVQLLLVAPLDGGHVLRNLHGHGRGPGGGSGKGDRSERFAGGEADVAVFVVVHVAFEHAAQGGGPIVIGCSEAAVPFFF